MARTRPARTVVAAQVRRNIGWRSRVVACVRQQRLLLGLVVCYVVFGFAASLLIPPWQSPDEPAHFEHAMLTPYNTDAELPQVQQPILQTFDEFRFYEYRHLPTPSHEPSSFSAISWAIIRQVGKTPLYYQLAWLSASWTNDVILQLYSMRWLSVVLSALTIPLVYAVVREVLPTERRLLALLAAAFVALLPMYGYIGASVNPDTIGAPIAAASVLFAARALRGKQTAVSLMLALVTAALAVFVRRSSVVLLPWVALVALFVVLPVLWRRLPKVGVLVGSGVLAALCIAVLLWPSQLAADWYPDPETRSSQIAGGFEGQHAFALAAHTDGSASSVSYQIPRYEIAQLRGNSITITAHVRGETGQANGTLAMTTEKAALASVPVAPGTQWQAIVLETTIPNDAQSLFITISGTSAATVEFDAITATRGPSAEPVVVSNGSAEDTYTWWQARFLSQSFVDYSLRIGQAFRLGTYVSPRAMEMYPWFLDNLSSSFIGRFGWMAISLPAWLENGLRLFGTFLAVSIVLVWRQTTMDVRQRRVLVFLALLLVGGILTLLLEYTPYLSYATFPQGRYLFPFLAPIAVLLICGLAQWLPHRYDRAALVGGTAALLGLNVWCWFALIIPYFYA